MTQRANPNGFRSVLVTGGGGYVGSALVPQLLQDGYRVKVVDTFWYGREVFQQCAGCRRLEAVELDIRDRRAMHREMAGIDAVLHLACISNDPSCELDPALAKSVNYDCFAGLLEAAAAQRVKRFVYASSSSIYGVQEGSDVCEDTPPRPLTDYSRYKLACERDLVDFSNGWDFERVIVRPATVCGYAPRMRLDLTVNVLTIHALVNKKIRVFGGKQLRPNIHIRDMVRAYGRLLAAPRELVDRQAFNVGYQNHRVEEIAEIVRRTLGDGAVLLEYEPSSDDRSYHINSDKIERVLGFRAEHTIEEAVADIAAAFRGGKLADPMSDPRYVNIKRMQQLRVQ